MAVTKACKEQQQWAFGLIGALTADSLYSSDLRKAALRGLRDAELTASEWHELLAATGQPELLAAHGAHIGRLLYALVKDGGRAFALDLLDQANGLAFSVWQTATWDCAPQHLREWAARGD